MWRMSLLIIAFFPVGVRIVLPRPAYIYTIIHYRLTLTFLLKNPGFTSILLSSCMTFSNSRSFGCQLGLISSHALIVRS
jgi:hypothetical protein